jgi:hypothetical protein
MHYQVIVRLFSANLPKGEAGCAQQGDESERSGVSCCTGEVQREEGPFIIEAGIIVADVLALHSITTAGKSFLQK